MALLLAMAAGCLLAESPAFGFNPFATHEVTAQFATSAGEPLANAAVRVFAPGDLKTPVETGHTDAQGKFVFDADSDGMWTAEASTGTEVARVMIRVGAGSPTAAADAAAANGRDRRHHFARGDGVVVPAAAVAGSATTALTARSAPAIRSAWRPSVLAAIVVWTKVARDREIWRRR